MTRIVWSASAREDRRAVFDYIAIDSPQAALTTDERISSAMTRLVQFPLSGRAGRVDGTFELVVSRTAFIAVYCLYDDIVEIVRILHGARQWPPESDS